MKAITPTHREARKNKFEVVCFGSAMVDAFVQTDTTEERGHLIIPYGCKQLMKSLFFEIGGGGTNTSVAFSRLGLKTGYIGKVGSDQNGNSVLGMLKKEKVSFLGRKTLGETSGFSVVLVSRDKHRSILAYKGINDMISKRDVKSFETKWLYLSSMMGESFHTQLELAKEQKREGARIAFNPSEYLIKAKNLREFLKLTDVLILNKEEAGLLVKGEDKLKGLYNLGPRIVVITDGERKVYCYDGKKVYTISPKKMKKVDKTGAGDAFSSGFVAGLIRNKPIEFCLKLGVREAESVIKHVGAKNNLLRMKLK